MAGAALPFFHFPSPPALHPSSSPFRVCFAPLDQDAPLLDLGPKGRCPLGLSRSRDERTLLRSCFRVWIGVAADVGL